MENVYNAGKGEEKREKGGSKAKHESTADLTPFT